MSGIAISNDVVEKYQELKLGHNYRYIILTMSSNLSEVIVEKTAGPSANYDDFLRDLPKDDCRYAIYDFEYTKDGGQRNKIVFAVWCPESSKIKPKMLYTSTKDSLKKKLVGLAVEIQATDSSEISREAVMEKVDK